MLLLVVLDPILRTNALSIVNETSALGHIQLKHHLPAAAVR
jgi:hypothetical protein